MSKINWLRNPKDTNTCYAFIDDKEENIATVSYAYDEDDEGNEFVYYYWEDEATGEIHCGEVYEWEYASEAMADCESYFTHIAG